MNLRTAKIPPLYVLRMELDYFQRLYEEAELSGVVPIEQRQVYMGEIVYRKDLYRFVRGHEYKRPLPAEEKEALVQLFERWHGFSWGENRGWIGLPKSMTRGEIKPFSSHPSDWYGILVENGQVVLMNLSANNCQGQMVTDWSPFNHIMSLDLSNNLISGTVPSSISCLSTLELLNLSCNQLTGRIPGNMFIPLARLKTLNLSCNALSGNIPDGLGALGMLTDLNLAMNNLQGRLPSSLSQVTRLRQLHLYSNRLTGTLPDWLAQLARLQTLNLSMNQFEGSIAVVTQLPRLTCLVLTDCHFSGTLPSDMSKLSSLTIMHMQHNKLSGCLPPTLSSLGALEFLNLQDNELTGTVPEELGRLTNLKSLVLSGNRITMPFPRSLSQLEKLIDFHVCHWWPSEHHEIQRAFVPLHFHRMFRVLPSVGVDNLGVFPATTEQVEELML